MFLLKYRVVLLFLVISGSITGFAKSDEKKEPEQEVYCPDKKPPVPEVKRDDVYKASPYKQGEMSVFKVSYMGALAGTGTIEVKRPYKYEGIWHRSFHAEAKTGD